MKLLAMVCSAINHAPFMSILLISESHLGGKKLYIYIYKHDIRSEHVTNGSWVEIKLSAALKDYSK